MLLKIRKIINKKDKGFTLAEMLTVMVIFMIAMTLLTTIFMNLVRSTLIANDYYQSLENVKLGTDKVFDILKSGWSFKISSPENLDFKDVNCVTTTISYDSNLKILKIIRDFRESEVFDPNLVKVNNIIFATDTPNTFSGIYSQTSVKIIFIFYDLEIQSRSGLTSTLKFQQAVAPLNSIVSHNQCN